MLGLCGSAEANAAFEQARPQVTEALTSAVTAIKQMPPAHVEELYALARPPITVKPTFEAAAILFGMPGEWESARSLLSKEVEPR